MYDWRSKFGKRAEKTVVTRMDFLGHEDQASRAQYAAECLECDGRTVLPFLSIDTIICSDGKVVSASDCYDKT